MIRTFRADDRARLREIMIAAKAHWGYDLAWVRAWVDGGAFTIPASPTAETFVAESDGAPVAWAQLVPRGDVGWLEDLWVEPRRIGFGIGRALFAHSAARARDLGLGRLEWEAEAQSVGFYERMGGRFLRDSDTIEWGRVLPIMGLDLGFEQGRRNPFEGAGERSPS